MTSNPQGPVELGVGYGKLGGSISYDHLLHVVASHFRHFPGPVKLPGRLGPVHYVQVALPCRTRREDLVMKMKGKMEELEFKYLAYLYTSCDTSNVKPV